MSVGVTEGPGKFNSCHCRIPLNGMEQLQNGLLEIRTERTSNELEEIHAADLADLLEMKREDARWDDYRTLIDFMG